MTAAGNDSLKSVCIVGEVGDCGPEGRAATREPQKKRRIGRLFQQESALAFRRSGGRGNRGVAPETETLLDQGRCHRNAVARTNCLLQLSRVVSIHLFSQYSLNFSSQPRRTQLRQCHHLSGSRPDDSRRHAGLIPHIHISENDRGTPGRAHFELEYLLAVGTRA